MAQNAAVIVGAAHRLNRDSSAEPNWGEDNASSPLKHTILNASFPQCSSLLIRE